MTSEETLAILAQLTGEDRTLIASALEIAAAMWSEDAEESRERPDAPIRGHPLRVYRQSERALAMAYALNDRKAHRRK